MDRLLHATLSGSYTVVISSYINTNDPALVLYHLIIVFFVSFDLSLLLDQSKAQLVENSIILACWKVFK